MNTETTIECPEIVEEEHLVYLDDLQESGITTCTVQEHTWNENFLSPGSRPKKSWVTGWIPITRGIPNDYSHIHNLTFWIHGQHRRC